MREELEDNHYIEQSWLEEEKFKSQEAVHQAKAMLKGKQFVQRIHLYKQV